MFGFFQLRNVSTYHRFRIDQFVGAQSTSAAFALVAVSFFESTLRTGSGDVSVGQKLFVFGVVILFGGFFDEFSVLIKFQENFGSSLVVNRIAGSGVNVERNSETLERILDHAVVFVHDILRGNTFILGFQGNWHAMLVGAADKSHFLSVHPEKTGINISRNIHAGKVSDVNRSVGIRQSRSNEGTFEVSHCAMILLRVTKISENLSQKGKVFSRSRSKHTCLNIFKFSVFNYQMANHESV